MKNKTFKIIILYIFALFLPLKLLAQKKGAFIGKVDVCSLTMLHPYMMWYDPARKAFKVSRDKEGKQKFEQEKIENKEKIDEIQAEKKSIKENIQKEEQRHRELVATLNKKYLEYNEELSTATIILYEVTYKSQMEKENMTHKSKLYSMYGQAKVCDEKIEKLKYNFSDEFTTPVETKKRFLEIINDVKNYSKQVAEKKGISIVLNSSYRRLLALIPDKRNTINRLNNSFTSVLTTPFPKEDLENEGENAIINYYKGIETDTNNWLNQSTDVLESITKSIVDEDVLVGGIDLTEDVLFAIYKNYKIDSNLTKAIVHCLKTK